MRNLKGFTLIEVVVVTMIIGILASLAVPQTLKIMESAKLQDAIGMSRIVSNAVRMANLDYPNTLNISTMYGKLVTASSAGTCSASGPSANVSDLTNCRYIASQDWDNMAYVYYACNSSTGGGGGCCAAGLTSCATRKAAGSYGDFSKWEVTIALNGACNTPCSSTCTTYQPGNCPVI